MSPLDWQQELDAMPVFARQLCEIHLDSHVRVWLASGVMFVGYVQETDTPESFTLLVDAYLKREDDGEEHIVGGRVAQIATRAIVAMMPAAETLTPGK